MKDFYHFLLDESGATAIEYGLILVLITIGTISATIIMGQFLNNTFNHVGSGMNTAR